MNDLLHMIGQEFGLFFQHDKTSRTLSKKLAKALADRLQKKGFHCAIVQDQTDAKRYWVHLAR